MEDIYFMKNSDGHISGLFLQHAIAIPTRFVESLDASNLFFVPSATKRFRARLNDYETKVTIGRAGGRRKIYQIRLLIEDDFKDSFYNAFSFIPNFYKLHQSFRNKEISEEEFGKRIPNFNLYICISETEGCISINVIPTDTADSDYFYFDESPSINDNADSRPNTRFRTTQSRARATINLVPIIKKQHNQCALSVKFSNDNHNTFKAQRTGECFYFEGHHIIPLSKQENIDRNIDVEANITCLCPTCHRKIHHGLDEDRRKMVEALYVLYAEQLRNCVLGRKISRAKLLKYYGLSSEADL